MPVSQQPPVSGGSAASPGHRPSRPPTALWGSMQGLLDSGYLGEVGRRGACVTGAQGMLLARTLELEEIGP